MVNLSDKITYMIFDFMDDKPAYQNVDGKFTFKDNIVFIIGCIGILIAFLLIFYTYFFTRPIYK
jgi:hypothetical protein